MPPSSHPLDWVPRVRARPSVCVVSVMTAELLADWGGAAVETNANWAVAHGYSYSVFTERLAPPALHAVWSNPRAVAHMLRRGRRECAVVFYLDGDALVSGVERPLESILRRFLPGAEGIDGDGDGVVDHGGSTGNNGGVEIVASCHSPFADASGGCLGPPELRTRNGGHHALSSASSSYGGSSPYGGSSSICACGRAAMATTCTDKQRARMLQRPIASKEAVPWCFVNSGAYLVRSYVETKAQLAELSGLQAADWPRDGQSLGLPWAWVCHCGRLSEADLAKVLSAALFFIIGAQHTAGAGGRRAVDRDGAAALRRGQAGQGRARAGVHAEAGHAPQVARICRRGVRAALQHAGVVPLAPGHDVNPAAARAAAAMGQQRRWRRWRWRCDEHGRAACAV